MLCMCLIIHSVHFLGNMKDSANFLVLDIISSQPPVELLQLSQVAHVVCFDVELMVK